MNSIFSSRWFFVQMFLLFLAFYPVFVKAQRKELKKKQELSKQLGENSPFKKYNEVITTGAETQDGLFSVHKVGNNYYFELPEAILEKEMLIVSRISGTPHKFSAYGAGAYTKQRPHQVIRFQRWGNSILMRLVHYKDIASNELPISQSVKSNNFEPIVYSFDIEAMNIELSSYVISVKDFFTTDVPLIGIKNSDFGISGVDKSRSMVSSIKVFPSNIEVRHVLTYRASKLPYEDRNNSLSFELNQSLVLLPEQPMTPRQNDIRVGFFSTKHFDFDTDAHNTGITDYILRWRLEPSDWDAYNRGELVEPVKPIVYYLDPATPDKWKAYIKKGVEDWKQCFEQIGFKNAILAKHSPSPKEDPNWDINDFQYSVIRYVANERKGAMGSNVHDPRTGEILKADIHLMHNNIRRHRNYFFIQTAAANPDARCLKFNDEVMGQLIRRIISHEVGHTLGLQHNFAASRAYHVDSLRSPSFTVIHGNSASIMDYAWGNYIAQPQDSVKNFYAQIGEYDHYAINYGYRLIPNITNPKQEENTLNQWIKEQASNPHVRFLNGIAGYMDLGNDPIKASELGIKNLKLITDNLIKWTSEEGKDYSSLTELYDEVYDQFERYMEPVQRLVGGRYYLPKTSDEEGPVYIYVSREYQKRAVNFINVQLFRTPIWLIDHEILERVPSGLSGVKTLKPLKEIQQQVLANLLQNVLPMIQNEALNGNKSYTVSEMYKDLIKEIFKELKTFEPIDIYRRTLQKTMIDAIGQHVNIDDGLYNNTDIPSLALANLKILKNEIKDGLLHQPNEISRYHLYDLLLRIDRIVDAK